MSYLDELNSVQREAVTAIEGPVMIVAGPGSGKTKVLTTRIAHLMNEGADSFSILALTFTNKAAKEMKERVEKIVGTEARNLYIGTFHSVFARILRYEATKLGYPANFTIYDTDDAKNLLKSIIKEMALNDTLYKPNIVYNRISSAKNSLVGPAEYQNDYNIQADDAESGRPKIGLIYEQYAKRCFMAGAMDFDDLLLKMYQLLERFPDVLHKYQHRFKYVLIDEFQDTNFAQYSIVKKLGDVFQNICVVGDDAQSIYSFRGATIANILNFEKDYPEVRVFKLEQNYRSTQHIVKAANKVIVNNKTQITKEIWTENNDGEKIKLVKAMSDNDEGRMVCDMIFEEKMQNQRSNNDFVILYRTNAQSRAFEEQLRRLNIHYVIYGGISFYQRKEIRDVVAYLRLTVNHNDEEALKRIINFPTRGIGQTTMDKAAVLASQQNVSLWTILEHVNQQPDLSRAATPIYDFVMMIKSFAVELKKQNAFDLSTHIAKASGILKELYNDKTPEGVSRYENIQALLNGIKEFTESEEVLPAIDSDTGEVLGNAEGDRDKTLAAYLQQITLLTDADKDKNDIDRVKLMTIHAAKGLEFPCVFVVGLEENLFPSMMALDSREDLEEERRLFYVAITRAKDKLTLTYAATRYKYGNLNYCEPSRFIAEIHPSNIDDSGVPKAQPKQPMMRDDYFEAPRKTIIPKVPKTDYVHNPSPDFVADDTSNIQPGMEVEHQRFGIGTIDKVEGGGYDRIVSINFQNGVGIKKIMLKYAKLHILKSISNNQ